MTIGLANVLSPDVLTSPASAFRIVIIGFVVTTLAATSSFSSVCFEGTDGDVPGYAGGGFGVP